MTTDGRTKVLVALRPGVRQKFEEAIGDMDHTILFCHTFEHAQRLMSA